MRQLSFKRHRFPPDIIRHSIWLYARFTLSFRDVEEMATTVGRDLTEADEAELRALWEAAKRRETRARVTRRAGK